MHRSLEKLRGKCRKEGSDFDKVEELQTLRQKLYTERANVQYHRDARERPEKQLKLARHSLYIQQRLIEIGKRRLAPEEEYDGENIAASDQTASSESACAWDVAIQTDPGHVLTAVGAIHTRAQLQTIVGQWKGAAATPNFGPLPQTPTIPDIDAVVTFVHDSDKTWRRDFDLHKGSNSGANLPTGSQDKKRFQCGKEVIHCLEPIRLNLPWIRKVVLVVSGDGQN